jgi:TetR/AcrR family transcriptional regulator of autoinduction and epiphytic fitness
MARPRSDISERVLRAAGPRFLRDGVDGASMREIARDARTSLGMITYYFPTKDDLFAAVVERAYTVLLADIGAALAPDAPFARQLERLHQRVAAITDEEFLVIRLVVRELLVSSPRTPALLARFSRGHIPLIVDALRAACARGEVRPELDPLAAMLAVIATGVGAQLATRLLAGALPAPVSLGAVSTSLQDLLLHGVAPRSR